MSERQHIVRDLMIFLDVSKKQATVVGFDLPFVVRMHPHPDNPDWCDNDRLYETIARAIARD